MADRHAQTRRGILPLKQKETDRFGSLPLQGNCLNGTRKRGTDFEFETLTVRLVHKSILEEVGEDHDSQPDPKPATANISF